ncbi:MAG: hypothetical protein LUH22_17375 [Bacteroides sp.]|nr:hypothetical protein [Bacteroides sp.]
MRHILVILTIIFSHMASYAQQRAVDETGVRASISRQMEVYPASTLKDLYKNFFQDRFGPGHLVNDTVAAKNYLLKELESLTAASGEILEPTGWQQNFYRVNLSVLKNNLIPMEVFFDAFLQSAGKIKEYSIEAWRKEWAQIESIIQSMNLNLPGYEQDSAEIQERLKERKYVGHHSKQYNEAYHPHYRIISKKIVEEKILPFLGQEE